MNAYHKGWEKGQEDGHETGFRKGYHFGRCEAVLQHVQSFSIQPRQEHVLYISPGISSPYDALDQAIINGFHTFLPRLTVTNPNEDVLALVESLKPDLVLVLYGVSFPAEKVDQIRQKGITTAIWFSDDPYYTDWTSQMAPHYDYVFTLESNCVSFYSSLGCKQVYHMPFATDPYIFRPTRAGMEYEADICFIGSAFKNRLQFFDELAPFLKDYKVMISGFWWNDLHHYQMLADQIQMNHWLSPLETAAYYSEAKIVINLHRSSENDPHMNQNSYQIAAASVNPRTFEISGCGTLQMTDDRGDLSGLYTPGEEVVVYNSVEDIKEKIVYYLAHEHERREISYRGLYRTMSEHTYAHRLYRMIEIVFDQHG